MSRAILCAVALFVLVGAPAHAQLISNTNNNTNTPVAIGGAGGAGGTAAATGFGGSSKATSGPASAATGPATATINGPTFPASTSQVLWTPPSVYAPPVVGGNLCAVGASSGVSWLGAGLALGASWESDNCERRQLAALMYNAGNSVAAKELLCDQRAVYDAMKRAGTPCVVRAAWEPAGQPVAVAPAPAPAPAPPPTQVAAFDASQYSTGAACLNAAFARGAPLALCRMKP